MKPEPTRRPNLRARKFGIAALASALMLVALAPVALAGAAPRPIVFDYLQLGSQCVYATAPAGATVELTWKNANGALKLRETQVANESGDLYYCSAAASKVLAIGDRLKAIGGSATHKLVIPKLTITVDRILDKVKGTAPAGSNLRVECAGDGLPSFEPCVWTKRVTASAARKWSANVPWDVRGGRGMSIRWRSAAGDIVYAGAVAPFVTLTLGESVFSGATKAGRAAHLTLRDPDTHEVKAQGDAMGDPAGGRFQGEFTMGGAAVSVSAGDELTTDIAPDVDMIVPDIEGTASASTNIVSGRCFDTGRFEGDIFVELIRSGERDGWAFGDPDETGSFSLDFNGEFGFKDAADLEVGDTLLVRCMQGAGDWVQREVIVGD